MVLSNEAISQADDHLLLEFVDEVGSLSSTMMSHYDDVLREFNKSKTIPIKKINKIKKALSTIKGTAGFFNLQNIEKMSSGIDEKMNLWLQDKLSSEEIFGIHKSLQALYQSLIKIKSKKKQVKEEKKLHQVSNFKEEELLNDNIWTHAYRNSTSEDTSHTDHQVSMNQLITSFYSFVQVIARQFDKNVSIDIESDIDQIPSEFAYDLTSIIVPVVRNSIEHGIEKTEERKRQKKSLQGVIKVIIANTNDGMNLTIFDDGQGIDVDRISQGTKLQDLIDQNYVESISEEDKRNMILIKEISGNFNQISSADSGCGFDMVRSVMKKYQGTYEVFSKYNQGTLFEFIFRGVI